MPLFLKFMKHLFVIQILDSDEAELYWSEKIKTSISNVTAETALKKEKLDALLVLDQVNTFLDIKV
jgi:hypothetical protein